MNGNKHHLKSITIWSQIICIIIVICLLASGPEPLSYDHTQEELCDWAYAMGKGQTLNLICTGIISMNLIGIYGRMRAKKGLGKDE